MSRPYRRPLRRALPVATSLVFCTVIAGGCRCADRVVSIPEPHDELTSSGTPDDGADPGTGPGTGEPGNPSLGDGSPPRSPPGPDRTCVDLDGDGYGTGLGCLGPDCDDGDPALGQDGTRSCYAGPAGTAGVGVCVAGTQSCVAGALGPCEGQVMPSAETCNGVDDDCDGAIDDGLVQNCYTGPAGTMGVGACHGGKQTCSAGVWGACAGEVTPLAETCNGLDDDCDGAVDEKLARSCYDGPAGTAGVGVCRSGTQTCSAGAWGACGGEVKPGTESCNGLDDDCDGATDDGLVRSCYDGPAGTQGVGACKAGQQTCSAGAWGSCAGEVTPSAESCDAQDNDCDGQVDENVSRSCYPGPPATLGVGLCTAGVQLCAKGAWGACGGYTLPDVERCDGADDNCNGAVDENVSVYSQPGSNQSTQPVYQPVDIVVVVDNSSSMTDEIQAVERNLNVSFAAILAQSGLDYRVILISKHGRATVDQSICITSPLSGNGSCSGALLAACPVNGPRFFQYSTEIGSHDSLYRILATYAAPDACGRAPNGWSGWLRAGAKTEFIEITDDGPLFFGSSPADRMTAASFTQQLTALSPARFGTVTKPTWSFHSIVGQKENVPAIAAWKPTDPLVTSLCTGNGGNVVQNGMEYQRLSVATGGLRYPICQYQSFDAIFKEVAAKIITGSKLDCVFTVGSVPADSSIGNTKGELVPTNGGATVPLTHVANEAACGGAQAFYTTGNDVHLCPAACTLWQADPTAIVNVLFTCSPQVQ